MTSRQLAEHMATIVAGVLGTSEIDSLKAENAMLRVEVEAWKRIANDNAEKVMRFLLIEQDREEMNNEHGDS